MNQQLNEFFMAWKAKSHARIFNTLQLTWLETNLSTWKRYIDTMFFNKDLRKWKVVEQRQVGDAAYDFEMNVVYFSEDRRNKRRITVRMICEVAPYRPSSNGVWGVNPISAFKGLN